MSKLFKSLTQEQQDIVNKIVKHKLEFKKLKKNLVKDMEDEDKKKICLLINNRTMHKPNYVTQKKVKISSTPSKQVQEDVVEVGSQ
jgi:hypothetical protein